MDVVNLKQKAKKILGNVNFSLYFNEDKILSILKNIIDDEISENQIEFLYKTLENIENYMCTKEKMIIQEKDYEYLKNIAEALRAQDVRIGDKVPFSLPIFKIHIDEQDREKNFTFITREGANKYIEFNSTILKHLPEKQVIDEEDEKRKVTLYDVENNTNLEIEKIIEIIKRNF